MAPIIQSFQNGPTSEVQDQKAQICKFLVSLLEKNIKLSSENAALKKQLATKESSWETEKSQILKVLEAEKTTKPRPEEEGITILQYKLKDLQNNLLDAHNTNAMLDSEVTALKKKMATKESSWQQWKSSILRAADGETALRVQVQGELETLRKEKDEEISSLKQSLLQEQEENLSAFEDLEKALSANEELEKALSANEEMNNCIREDLMTEWEKKWQTAQEDMALESQTREEHHVREMTKVIKEKDELISIERRDKKALEAQSLELRARLEEMERQMIQSEAEWSLKLTTLEDQKRCEVSAEEGSSSSTDLHPQEKSKVVLTKAAIKKLEKERKEREEREKKDNKRRQQEELKRQKKEQKEREEREKKDNKRRQQEELKRQKEEKQAREEEDRAVTPHPPMRRARRVIRRMSAWFSAASCHSPAA